MWCISEQLIYNNLLTLVVVCIIRLRSIAMIEPASECATILTPRQLEILELVSKGCSNIDIARLLNISPNTVKTHLATVLERLHVSNRTEASVWYEKHFNVAVTSDQHDEVESQNIVVGLLYKKLSRTTEIAENLSKLLRGFELFEIHSVSSESMLEDSANMTQNYLIKVDDLTEVNGALQIILFDHSQSEQQELLYKSAHDLNEYEPSRLIKHAISIYRHILQHQVKQTSGTKLSDICRVLVAYESISFEQLQSAISRCDVLVEQFNDWHLPLALKSVMLNKLITNGMSEDVTRAMQVQAESARKSLSMEPESSWSQLAFACFCALNSDLVLAEKHLKVSISYNTCQFRAWQLLGQIQAFTAQTSASLDTFQKLLSDFPHRESDAACYAALALVHYCAGDFENSKNMANRALLYEDSPQVPMYLTLLSIAEVQHDEQEVIAVMGKIKKLNINPQAIGNSLQVASKIVPPELFLDYQASIVRTGLIKGS